jgi:hypothetical protein
VAWKKMSEYEIVVTNAEKLLLRLQDAPKRMANQVSPP